jgi:hypothetical protein
MQRHMPQDVFDSLVIVRAMADLTGDERIVHDTIRQYVEMYPGEHAQALEADVNQAAVTAWDATRLILKLRPTEAEDDQKLLYAVLNSLNEVLKNLVEPDASSRNVFGFRGSLFRSKSSHIPDRVATCRKHISAACQHLLRESFGRYQLSS